MDFPFPRNTLQFSIFLCMSGRSHDDMILQRCQGECWDGALALLALIPGRLGNMAQDMLLLDVKLSNCILLYLIVFYYMSLHRITKRLYVFICYYMLSCILDMIIILLLLLLLFLSLLLTNTIYMYYISYKRLYILLYM